MGLLLFPIPLLFSSRPPPLYVGGQAQVEKSSFSIVLGLQIRWLRSLVLLKVRTRLAGVLILSVKRGFRIQKGTWNHEFAPNLLSFSPRSPPLRNGYTYCHFLTVWGVVKFVFEKKNSVFLKDC